MRKIIYERPDGGVSIVHPAFNIDETKGWTDADSEQRAFDKLPADALNPRFIEAVEIPPDRTFRNAWKADLTVDFVKAKDIVLKLKPDADVSKAQTTDDLKALL